MIAAAPCDLFVIGASAGGIQALRQILPELPASFPASILLVVHLASGGTSALAAVLQRGTRLAVQDARDGDVLLPGLLSIAVADHHLTVTPGMIHVRAGPDESHYRPCIDQLFRSAAASYGARVTGIVLSGMLRDGAEGLRAIAAAGGTTIVQDPADAEEAGMPGSALSGHHVSYCLPARKIAMLMVHLSSEHAERPRVPSSRMP